MSQSDKPFSVSDRRHFTPDGRVRDGDEPDPGEEKASSSPGQPADPAAGQPSGGERERPAAATTGPADFGQFLLSLGTQAGMMLSGQVEGEDPAELLEHARSIISILEMLEDKTQGRRTDDESRLLEGLLFQLRMAYVEKTRERS